MAKARRAQYAREFEPEAVRLIASGHSPAATDGCVSERSCSHPPSLEASCGGGGSLCNGTAYGFKASAVSSARPAAGALCPIKIESMAALLW